MRIRTVFLSLAVVMSLASAAPAADTAVRKKRIQTAPPTGQSEQLTPEAASGASGQAVEAAQAGPSGKGDIDKATGMEFLLVKGGCYKMGDAFDAGGRVEKPVHEVCVKDFYLGKYEVTQGEWHKIMGSNPSTFKQCGTDCPVESVSWLDVQEFIAKLNAASGREYRLPTEAEWEYAARSGGRKEKWAGTSDEEHLWKFAWLGTDSDRTTHRVGLKKPNGLGLHDMTGNVMEWCQDWYGDTYYENSPKNNPPGVRRAESRVLRGGSWVSEATDARTSGRERYRPDNGFNYHGFRLLLPVK